MQTCIIILNDNTTKKKNTHRRFFFYNFRHLKMRAIFTCECFLLSFFCLFAHDKKRNGKKRNWSFTIETKKKQKMKCNEKELNKKKSCWPWNEKTEYGNDSLAVCQWLGKKRNLGRHIGKKKSQERRSLSFFLFFFLINPALRTQLKQIVRLSCPHVPDLWKRKEDESKTNNNTNNNSS